MWKNMGPKMWAERSFLGKTQSDKFLDPGQSRITFMAVEVRREGRREGRRGRVEKHVGRG